MSRPSGTKLSPNEAGDFALHASIVHLADVVADHEELEPNHRQDVLPFAPFAVTTAQFATASPSALLSETHAYLQNTLALIYPPALAA